MKNISLKILNHQISRRNIEYLYNLEIAKIYLMQKKSLAIKEKMLNWAPPKLKFSDF